MELTWAPLPPSPPSSHAQSYLLLERPFSGRFFLYLIFVLDGAVPSYRLSADDFAVPRVFFKAIARKEKVLSESSLPPNFPRAFKSL